MPRKKTITREEFIEQARKVHGDAYGYGAIPETMKTTDKVEIHCLRHGTYEQGVRYHLAGHRCRECGLEDREYPYGHGHGRAKDGTAAVITKEIFLERSRAAHGSRYDYSQVKWVNTNTPVTIVCPEHGAFIQFPPNHWGGHGCRHCGYVESGLAARLTVEQVAADIAELADGRYEFVSGDPHGEVVIRCTVHDTEFTTVQPPQFRARVRRFGVAGCPQCVHDRGQRKRRHKHPRLGTIREDTQRLREEKGTRAALIWTMRARGDTLREIGQRFGLTRERVRQIEAACLKFLTTPPLAPKPMTEPMPPSLPQDGAVLRHYLSVRAGNVLGRVGILTLGDLKAYLNENKRSPEEALMRLDGVGVRVVEDILSLLEKTNESSNDDGSSDGTGDEREREVRRLGTGV